MFLSKEKIRAPKNLRTTRLSVIKTHISTPVVQPNVSSPNKVIKALYDYNATSPHELSFKRGDFFLVTGRETDDQFYEAFNPMTQSRGTVPVHYFQALEKNERHLKEPPKKTVEEKAKSQPLYGVVMYDFEAERSDELDAKKGENIIIIAQSNAEWYVAKPIGRLGGPGLIPVSFVNIHDASTGRPVENRPIQPFQNVEDWKKKTQVYEEGSISLEHHMQHMNIVEEEDLYDDYFASTEPVQRSRVISAKVDSYILESDQYWFIVFARLDDGKYRVLYRLYEDFYDFHINFLQRFPLEAGKREQKRILPFMPGPVECVDSKVTEERSRSLSLYCSDLLQLPDYLSDSTWVQDQLFGIHEGDIETDIDPNQEKAPENPKTTIKVKIVYKDEIFAIKVPVPSSMQFLQDKVNSRLGFQAELLLKGKSNNYIHLTQQALEEAVSLGKLTVFAGL
ncbi:hypothetical protein BY458DRAFT_499632 [Sporodiniella umbellata]|nr:hypothetical protein BY458DRAFT_499632 [Sporodiniella umbellata]